MDREKENGIYNNARLTFGLNNQDHMIIEECCELSQAINKWYRLQRDELATKEELEEAFNHIIEEKEDVKIVIEQFEHNYQSINNDALAKKYREEKLNRLNNEIIKRQCFKKIVKELDDAKVQAFIKSTN